VNGSQRYLDTIKKYKVAMLLTTPVGGGIRSLNFGRSLTVACVRPVRYLKVRPVR
jgi:isocitrate dehydrogenase